ncbi:MAG: alpha/beta fold hydrolase [Planctomycetota bacterium]|jgi:pimeloyl-[acyl-carrier protein] methyl ester esterase
MAPTICFVSGWSTTDAVWERVIARLPSSVSIVHRPWTEPLTLSEGNGPLILVGWSLGGMRALAATQQDSSSVAGLLLVGTSLAFCGGEGFPGTSTRVLKAMRLRLRKERRETLKDFAALCLAPGANDESAERMRTMASTFSDTELAVGLKALSELVLGDAPLSMPGRVLHGSDDRVVPVDAGQFMTECLGLDWQGVEGAGHALPLTHPDVIAAALMTLLKERT